MDSFPYTHPQAPYPPTMAALGTGINISDYFVPKLEVLDSVPSRMLPPTHHDINIPPPLTEIPLLSRTKHSPSTLKVPHYYPHEDSPRSLSVSNPNIPPPSPPYEEDPNSPTFFVDTFTKIRNLSGELFQVAGDTLAKGYATDNVKIEYYAHELLKIARQLNNTADDDDRKRLPPPLVRPRRIRRKHNEEEEQQQQQQQQIEEVDRKRKLGNGATPELYCHSCGTTDTPEWRRGPDGCKSLCNACGLHYAKILRRETMIPNRQPARTTMTLNNLLN